MKSVLISIDFVYNEDGKLVPVELNTNTSPDINTVRGSISKEDFLDTSEFFNHVELNNYLQDNNISKISVIAHTDNLFIKAFCEYYNYTYTLIRTSFDQNFIPEVEDEDDTLIIRITYDSYALVDDLYARDMYEFHNLIASESFATPVCFTENEFDTITEFELSQDGNAPNYIIKPRTPSYDRMEYPRVYKLETETELQNLKTNLTINEFITKFEYNSELSLVENRVTHLRSMDLIIGSDLTILNLLTYKELHAIAQDNEKLVIDYIVDENKILHPLEASKYYPTRHIRESNTYHFDENDKALMIDGTSTLFGDLKANDSGSLIKNYKFDWIENIGKDEYKISLDELNTFTTSSTEISMITDINSGLFVNITATNDTYGELSWYDGYSNTYLVKKVDNTDEVEYEPGALLQDGDSIFIYEKSTNTLIPFTVTNTYFDIKNIDIYHISLKKEPGFMIELTPELFILTTNACSSVGCFPANTPPASFCNFGMPCFDCGKSSLDCLQCGGAAVRQCKED